MPEGTALAFRKVVMSIKEEKSDMLVEALTPDFRGDLRLVEEVARSGLDVYAHNIETVERMTPMVRDPRATYRQEWDHLLVLEKCEYNLQ